MKSNPTKLIDPRTVLLAIPTHSGQIHAECLGGMVACGGLFAAFFPVAECSHPGLARNTIADHFMRSNFEWLVSVDADTGFSVEDFQYLMQPCDLDADYDAPGMAEPTRTTIALGSPGRPLDEKMLGAADLLVCAEYRYKKDQIENVHLGMGFVRIHRSVFECLQKLEHEKNEAHFELLRAAQDLEKLQSECDVKGDSNTSIALSFSIDTIKKNLPEPGGGPRLWNVMRDGRVFWDYFPSGPIISTLVPTSDWKGEDHGFFTLCMLAGINPRIEKRTRLVHFGRKGYVYGPQKDSGGQ